MNFPDKDFIIGNIEKKGYCIAKGLLSNEEYEIIREEAIRYFNNREVTKNKFPKALRGGVKAGMQDVLGYT